MTAQTGRTVSKYITVEVEDSAGTLRAIACNAVNGCGLNYDEVDLTAFSDAVKGVMLNQPGATLTLSGPMDTTATTGSHIVLSALLGRNTPIAINIKFGIGHAYETNEPVFGMASSATSGFLLKSYNVSDSLMYDAEFVVYAGSSAPAWATSAYTVT